MISLYYNLIPMPTMPIASEIEIQLSEQLKTKIIQAIHSNQGWISFDRFMEFALYDPEFGYYTGNLRKFGEKGDFVTASEISSFFAKTMCTQFEEIFLSLDKNIIEIGAGSGKFALEVIQSLDSKKIDHYFILEISHSLRKHQYELLIENLPPHLFSKVQWIDQIPQEYNGIVFCNELLDALPVDLIKKSSGIPYQKGVALENDLFIWKDKAIKDLSTYDHINLESLPDNYLAEDAIHIKSWINNISESISKGVVIIIDYGFNHSEYFHEQRSQGTLMCHFKHHAHDNPLIQVGIQDITSHVNFSYVAREASSKGLHINGFISQANFLINCGILELLEKVNIEDSVLYMKSVSEIQKLLSPSEMGDLFKVMTIEKNIDINLVGLKNNNKVTTL
ncbi:class I SAM-dependent methyltransferase [Candidatus Methylopumilus universalis]|uniref:class I SAM-dependent methyltransferase n=1 Tax=Candidatus Methylopumilus universalis TaxID=2588536 RepID=UPI00111E5488|nr:SAM-dependent methyltransferase [Candidatus Methylopumilus universalis]QDC95870.1 class I SAM-dependent methyltransferase [Candidatus Methylopumilus universalis]